jgi:S-methylmethionine-dependent homocysteine/selenocysteine methylase
MVFLDDDENSKEYYEWAKLWYENGIKMIGGCCEIGP